MQINIPALRWRCTTRTWQASSLALTSSGFWSHALWSPGLAAVTRQAWLSSVAVPAVLGFDDVQHMYTVQMQSFSLGSKTFRQVQGSPMGSPLCPALCLMVVSIYEEIWYSTHRTLLTNQLQTADLPEHFFQVLQFYRRAWEELPACKSNHHLQALYLRYVDNRLLPVPEGLCDLGPLQILTHEDFYKAPIVLETEPDQEFLGFQLELNPFEMIYQCPWSAMISDKWTFVEVPSYHLPTKYQPIIGKDTMHGS